MSNTFNEILKSIFQKALDLDKSEREKFFNNLSEEQKEYVDEVKSLIASYEKTEDFLEIASNYNQIFTSNENEIHPLIGKHIGPYLIESEIGFGGMGIVFVGRRDDKEFDQKVAIKILKQGLSTKYLVKRFENERQILANLQHPNIAKLFDGGKTSDGLPYLIMEFIQGLLITEYCAKNNLDIKQILELFRIVCSAVHYAHQNLIIHRDLKPANILINEQGMPKLLDFGIAKLLDESVEIENIKLTQTKMWHLTPDYASPEQIKGENITTGSDVYSLGVLLYELISGNQPYKFFNVSPLSINKTIDETNIIKPSEIVKQSINSKDEKKLNDKSEKQINAIKKSKMLKGDLDNIILKAMHKDPTQRYSSVQGLINDIERYLKGLPVNARKDTHFYRFSKFVNRHKIGAALFILFNILIFISIAAIIYQANIAAKERDNAKLEAQKSESVNDFLQEMLFSADPTEAGKDVKVYDILQKASKDVETGFKDQPGIEAAVRKTLGKTLTNLGEFEKAKPHLEKSLQLNEKIYGIESYQTGESLHELALYYHWIGDMKLADSLYKKSVNILRKNSETPPRALSSSINDYGILMQEQGNMNESLELLKEAYQIVEKNFGEKDRDIASIANNMALTLGDLKKNELAEKYYRQSLKIYLDLYGSNRPEISTIYNNLAYIYIDNEDYEKAHENFSKSLELKKNTWGENHSMVGLAYLNLGALEYTMNRFESAKENLIYSMNNFKISLNVNHIWVGLSYYWFAKYLIEDSKPAEAEKYIRKSLKIYEKNYPKNHINIISAKAELGIALLNQKKYIESEKLLLNGFEEINKIKGLNNFNTKRLLKFVLNFYEETKNLEKFNYYKKLADSSSK
ncbi:MAG: serine/threonine-protein kinase [Melioribacteraceae bacterium]